MEGFDEYQQFRRYRNGHQAFFLTNILIFISFIISLSGGEWAESKGVEYFILLSIPSTYINIRNTWHGAYYRKKDNPLLYNIIFFVTGLLYIWLFGSFGAGTEAGVIEDGKITWKAAQLWVGMLWISIPITYFIRHYIDKRKD